MPQVCKVCEAPIPIRDLIERLRTAGVSFRDCASTVKAIRDYDVSHAAVARHEQSGHFSVDAVLASNTTVDVKDLTLKSMIDWKLQLYWRAHKDVVPNDHEIRNWLKLWAELRQAEANADEQRMLREMFHPQVRVLPATAGEEINGE